MDNHTPGKRLVLVVITATENIALLVLLKKRAIDDSLFTKTTIQYIN